MIELPSEDPSLVASIATSHSLALHRAAAAAMCLTSCISKQMHAYHKHSQKVPADRSPRTERGRQTMLRRFLSRDAKLSRLARLATWCVGEQADDDCDGDDVHQDQDGSLSV